MKSRFCLVLLITAATLSTNPVLADSNASGGGITNSETVSLGGPYNHGGAIGSPDNTTISGVTFTGGFNATHIRFTGTLSSMWESTWASEANIRIREVSTSSFDWQNPGPTASFFGDTIDYYSSQNLTGAFAGGIDPGVGPWEVEFFETYDDVGGADSRSSNVEMTFEERVELVDANGAFTLGTLNAGNSANSVGEFGLPGLYDTYSITLNQAGLFTFLTDEDLSGYLGTIVDTEIAIFDSSGILIAEDDDSGNGLYSGIFDLSLAAGDYTLVVAPFLGGESFTNGWGVTPGPGTGDYVVYASLTAVPEPGPLAFVGFSGLGLLAFRRRK